MGKIPKRVPGRIGHWGCKCSICNGFMGMSIAVANSPGASAYQPAVFEGFWKSTESDR